MILQEQLGNVLPCDCWGCWLQHWLLTDQHQWEECRLLHGCRRSQGSRRSRNCLGSTLYCTLLIGGVLHCFALSSKDQINEARRTSNSTEKKTQEIKNRCFFSKIFLLCLDGFGFPPATKTRLGRLEKGERKPALIMKTAAQSKLLACKTFNIEILQL